MNDIKLGWGLAFVTAKLHRYGFEVVAGPFGWAKKDYREFSRAFDSEREAADFFESADFDALCRKQLNATTDASKQGVPADLK